MRLVILLCLVLCAVPRPGCAAECGELLADWPCGGPESVAAHGGHIFFGSGQAVVVAEPDPAAGLRIVTHVRTPAPVSGIAIEDGLAVVGTSAGVTVLDLTEPTDPEQIGGYHALSSPDVAIWEGEFLYIAGGETLEIVNVATPELPFRMGSLTQAPSGEVSALAVADGLCVATEGTDGRYALRVIDVSDPTAPQARALIPRPGPVLDLAVERRYAGVVTARELWPFEFGADGELSVLHALDLGIQPDHLDLSYRLAFVGFTPSSSDDPFTYRLQIVELDSVDEPRTLGVIDLAIGDDGGPRHTFQALGEAWVAVALDHGNESSLVIIDVSEPWSPIRQGAGAGEDCLPRMARCCTRALRSTSRTSACRATRFCERRSPISRAGSTRYVLHNETIARSPS